MNSSEVETWQIEHELQILGEDVPAPVTTFDEAAALIPTEHIKKLTKQGFTAPTPIQAQSWPILYAGRDIVGIAKTGSGKTLAFMIPAIDHILSRKPLKPGHGPICVVLAPTRELVQQIEAETVKVLPEGMRSITVYGGVSKGPQIDALRTGVHIVVATPGRLIDLLDSGITNLKRVTLLVLDEADRMLDLGFEPTVRRICSDVRAERQTLMFSATWPEAVQDIAKTFQREVVRIHFGSVELLANPDVRQHFIFPKQERDKLSHLHQLLNKYRGQRVLVFALYKKSANFLENLLRRDYNCIGIHSDKTQQQREAMLAQFKKQKDCILVGTDVAARGLDVKDLPAVINYEFPLTVDDYVHRIGRTGRAGAKGDAYTIISPNDGYFDGFAARDVGRLLEKVKQQIPPEMAKLGATVGLREKAKKPKIPETVCLNAHAAGAGGGASTKKITFDDSDDEEDEKPAKKHRT